MKMVPCYEKEENFVKVIMNEMKMKIKNINKSKL